MLVRVGKKGRDSIVDYLQNREEFNIYEQIDENCENLNDLMVKNNKLYPHLQSLIVRGLLDEVARTRHTSGSCEST